MLRRQRTGSVICTSCGVLVGVNDDKCYNCGRRNPGLWGFAPLLRSLGRDLGFVPFVIGTCVVVYVLTLVASRGNIEPGRHVLVPRPNRRGAVPVRRQRRGSGVRSGRWWTVLSAAWLHAGLLHILFNMMAVRQLAPPTAELYGPGANGDHLHRRRGRRIRAELVCRRVPAGAPVSRAAAQFTVGASASIAGLHRRDLYYGHRSGSSIVRARATR